MKNCVYEYKLRVLCPNCFSLSFKKSYKGFKCDNCKAFFNKPKNFYLYHKGEICVDNNVSSRKLRLNSMTGVIKYE